MNCVMGKALMGMALAASVVTSASVVISLEGVSASFHIGAIDKGLIAFSTSMCGLRAISKPHLASRGNTRRASSLPSSTRFQPNIASSGALNPSVLSPLWPTSGF